MFKWNLKLFPDMPFFKDLGISAFLTLVVVVAYVFIAIYGVLNAERPAVAIAVTSALSSLGILIMKFWGDYQAKRKDDEDRRERMSGTGNGNGAPKPPIVEPPKP